MVIFIDKPSVDELQEWLEQHKILERVLSEDVDGLTTGTVLLSYHYWASIDLVFGAIFGE